MRLFILRLTQPHAPIYWLMMWLGLVSLSCNLTLAEDATPIPSGVQVVGDVNCSAPPPTAQIISPASGQQAYVGQTVEILVSATDQCGVNRLQLNVGSRTGSTKSFPEPATNAEALLNWTPDREGTFDLTVIAYRISSSGDSVYSDPVTINLQAVGRDDTVSNPVSGQVAAVVVTTGECVGRVLINNLRIRAGPSTDFENLGNFSLNEQISIVGQNSDGSWLKMRRADATENWVINNPEWVALTGTCDSLPLAN